MNSARIQNLFKFQFFYQISNFFQIRILFKFVIPNCSDFRKEKQKKHIIEINWEASLTGPDPSTELHGAPYYSARSGDSYLSLADALECIASVGVVTWAVAHQRDYFLDGFFFFLVLWVILVFCLYLFCFLFCKKIGNIL
jgi:hypothetical protein